MTVTLIKCSVPGWKMDFPDVEAAIDELRRHICESCLLGRDDIDDPYDSDFPPVDVIQDGKRVECRNPIELLSTPCGCEYEIEGDIDWEFYRNE